MGRRMEFRSFRSSKSRLPPLPMPWQAVSAGDIGALFLARKNSTKPRRSGSIAPRPNVHWDGGARLDVTAAIRLTAEWYHASVSGPDTDCYGLSARQIRDYESLQPPDSAVRSA